MVGHSQSKTPTSARAPEADRTLAAKIRPMRPTQKNTVPIRFRASSPSVHMGEGCPHAGHLLDCVETRCWQATHGVSVGVVMRGSGPRRRERRRRPEQCSGGAALRIWSQTRRHKAARAKCVFGARIGGPLQVRRAVRVSTLHDGRYRTPCKTRFRLAGCAFAGRESNPLDRYERFQIISSPSPGLSLAQ